MQSGTLRVGKSYIPIFSISIAYCGIYPTVLKYLLLIIIIFHFGNYNASVMIQAQVSNYFKKMRVRLVKNLKTIDLGKFATSQKKG